MKHALLTLLSATVLSTAAAQTATKQLPLPPIQLDVLPYGTVTLSEGRYLINNYEGRGIDMYIFSPVPLRIATTTDGSGRATSSGTGSSAAPATTTAATTGAVTIPPAPAPATPAAVTPDAATLPNFLVGTFTGRTEQNQVIITYTILNRSEAPIQLNPSTLLIQQGDTYLAGGLTVRDTSDTPGTLAARGAQLGTITVTTTSLKPITVQWAALDTRTGQTHPITYTFTPANQP